MGASYTKRLLREVETGYLEIDDGFEYVQRAVRRQGLGWWDGQSSGGGGAMQWQFVLWNPAAADPATANNRVNFDGK